MAIVKGAFQLTGSISNVSFYKVAGSDRVIMRTKGGPTKRRLKVGPEFELVRKHQKEWAACVLFSQGLKHALGEVYSLADYNVSPVWNGLGKRIIKTDENHVIGERSLIVSAYRNELTGFNLNRNFAFNSVMGVTTEVSIDKEALKATALIPAMNSEQDLLNIQKLPYFRLILTLGVVSNIVYNNTARYGKYVPEMGDVNGASKSETTGWFSTRDLIPEMEITAQFNSSLKEFVTENTTYILSLGIQFGNVGFGGKTEAVKRACCGRILKVI